MERRTFLKESALGVGTLAAGLGVHTSRAQEPPSRSDVIGRPVRVLSIGFKQGHTLEEIAALVDAEGGKGADLIVLPETWRGQNEKSQEPLDGPTITTMARLAKKHRAYLVCPIDRSDGAQRFNSAVLLNRSGQVACIYNKLYPVWQEECVKKPPVIPGRDVCVTQTDFGRVGLAICFDVNWGALWEQMSNEGAELVIWPSAYSAGRSLQARAAEYNYYIVSCTWVPDCFVFDLDGEQLVYDKDNRGHGVNVTRVTLDLDRCIFHQDLNVPAKRNKLLQERGEDVVQEKWLEKEGWLMLAAKRPGVSARALAREYGLEELRHYINRSRCEIDKCRGWEFS